MFICCLRKQKVLNGLIFAILFFSCPAGAVNSVGSVYSWGFNYTGLDAFLDMDLDEEATWSAGIEYNNINIPSPTNPSLINQITLNVIHTEEKSWIFNGGLTYSNDLINQVYYSGPDLAVTYNLNNPVSYKTSEDEDDTDQYQKILSLTLGGDLHGYQVNLGSLSGTGTSKTGIKYSLSAGPDATYVTQFYPHVGLEVPLLNNGLVPSVSAGHYFYSRDPAVIAGKLNLLFNSGPGASSASLLAEGLFYNSWSTILEINFPWSLSINGNYGQDELISPDIWATSYGGGFSITLFDAFKAEMSYSESSQNGSVQDLYGAGLTIYF